MRTVYTRKEFEKIEEALKLFNKDSCDLKWDKINWEQLFELFNVIDMMNEYNDFDWNFTLDNVVSEIERVIDEEEFIDEDED